MDMRIPLPDEVNIILLSYDDMSIEDAVNITSTSKQFQHLISSNNKFWKKKFFNRCPTARKKYYIKEKSKKLEETDFEKKTKISINYIKQLQHYVFLMSNNNLTQNKKIKFERLLRSTAEDSMIYYFVLDELSKITSAQLEKKRNCNLTNKYYLGLISHYLKRYRFTYKLIKFLNMPKEKQLLEQLLTLVAQYFEPHISYFVIKMWFDDIAEKIRQRIKDKYPTYSISSTSNKIFSLGRDNNIYYNFWDPTEVESIMDILEKFIFSELEINQLLNILDLKDEYINFMFTFLRRHLQTITFYSVARRLGIYCIVIPVNYIEKHSVEILLWNSKHAEDFKHTNFLYVKEGTYPLNIVKGSHIYNYDEQLSPSNNTWIDKYIYKLKNNKDIQLQMIITCYMIIHARIELRNYNIHCTWNVNFLLNVLNRCLTKEIEDINIETEYKNITRTIRTTSDERKQPRKRTKRIKFAVGMIVTHLCKDYYSGKINNQYGVIVGWHSQCNSVFKSKLENTSLMFPYLRQCYTYYHICDCEKYSINFNQPHYIILTENNRICYVQQDFISIMCLPKEINNLEIGHFFSRFNNTYYVPNKNLAKLYPKDITVIKRFFS